MLRFVLEVRPLVRADEGGDQELVARVLGTVIVGLAIVALLVVLLAALLAVALLDEANVFLLAERDRLIDPGLAVRQERSPFEDATRYPGGQDVDRELAQHLVRLGRRLRRSPPGARALVQHQGKRGHRHFVICVSHNSEISDYPADTAMSKDKADYADTKLHSVTE